MKKDIVHLEDVSKEFKTKSIQHKYDDNMSVDEIFAIADEDLSRLDDVSRQLKESVKKEKSGLNFIQRELLSFGMFLLIMIVAAIVGIIYFFKGIWPSVTSELKTSIIGTQEELEKINDNELSFGEYFSKQLMMNVDVDNFQNSINGLEELTKFSNTIQQLETDPENVDWTKFSKEEKENFDKLYEKYKEQKKQDELKQQLSEELNKKMSEEN